MVVWSEERGVLGSEEDLDGYDEGEENCEEWRCEGGKANPSLP